MHRLLNLLVLFAAGAALASGQDAEQTLQKFEGKILVLRHPLQGSSQEYDVEGKVLKGGSEGPWTVYGGVLVDHISLMPDKVRVDGRRMLFLFLHGEFTPWELKKLKDRGDPPFPPSLKLEIRLDHAVDSPEQAQTILNRVFALNTQDLVDSFPDYWRGSLPDQLTYDPSEKQEAEFRWQLPPPRVRTLSQKAGPDAIDHEGVFHVGSGVAAPKATSTPEPKYSAIARYEKFQGTVVVNVIIGTDGTVRNIRIVRPLGLGLDEAAQSTIQTWRFRPATRDGKPVAVEMNIEVAFNLY